MDGGRQTVRWASILLMLVAAGCVGGSGTPAISSRAASAEGSPRSEPVALQRLADGHLAAGRWQEAADIYGRLLDMKRDDASIVRGYARAVIGLHQPGAATGPLETLLATTPNNSRALNLLGVAYDLLGRSADAAGAYRRGLAIAPATSR